MKKGKHRKERSAKGESFMQGVLSLMVAQVLIKFLGLVYNGT